MLDHPPRETEVRTRARAAPGIGVISATIPVLRALRETSDRRLGREIVAIFVVAIVDGCRPRRNATAGSES